MSSASWLKKVLRDLEAAIVLLVDAQIGRAPCGGRTFEEARARALEAADARITQARTDYLLQAATLSRGARRRAAAIFGATFALRARATGESAVPDDHLFEVVHELEAAGRVEN